MASLHSRVGCQGRTEYRWGELLMLLLCAVSLGRAAEPAKDLNQSAAVALRFEHRVLDPSGPRDPWVKIVGDLNGDKLPDVVIGGQNGPVVWYSAPDWKKTEIAGGGYQTVDGEVGDVDGDGDLDVIVGAEFWFENPRPKGDAAQGPWTAHRISSLRTHDIEVADLDGDGRLDLAARDQSGFGHQSGNKIHFWRQTSPTNWIYRTLECPHGEGLHLADIDRDGDLDVITGGRWYENTKKIVDGPWTEHVFAAEWHPDAAVFTGDFDGDGRLDVVLTRSEGEYKISWFEAPVDPRQSNWSEHGIDPSLDFAHGLAVADIDGDGGLDVVTAEMHQSKRDRVLVYLNQDKGERWAARMVATTGSHNIRVVDLGNDGRLDIVGANWSGPFQPIEAWIQAK